MSAAYELPQSGDPDAVTLTIAQITVLLNRLSTDVPAHLDANQTHETAIGLLAELREARQALQSIEAFTEAEAAARLGKGKHTVDGWQVEVRGGGTWKDWQHDRLAFAVCRDLAVDPSTGELVPEAVQIIDAVRSRLLNCARPSWRTTQLEPLGIAPGDYARWETGRRTVALTKDESA